MQPVCNRLFRQCFHINRPDGITLTANLYGTRHRPAGRRIVVWHPVHFDTGDHVDLDNARHALAEWLAGYEPRPEPVTSVAVPPG